MRSPVTLSTSSTFQRRWRLPHSCFVDRLGWIAEEDSVAIFVVLLIYNEDEPMFRDTLRTSALVFIAESDPFFAMQARFEFDLAGSDGRQHQASNGSIRLSRVEYTIC